MTEGTWDERRWAAGLMSGTSLDGVDVALIRTDGRRRVESGPSASLPYDEAFRDRLRAVLGRRDPTDPEVVGVARELTLRHAEAVRGLLEGAGIAAEEVGLLGFHGQTIAHDPAARFTLQIGDGALLAAETSIDVVHDFRSADVAAGGQGAPLAPLYHAALAGDEPRPLAVLNLGGVGNVTWLGGPAGKDSDPGSERILAFDTGPGNALIDDWARRHRGLAFDRDGALARSGQVEEAALARMLDNPYFELPPPKSLDRLDFDAEAVEGLAGGVEAGAATLTAFTAAAVAAAQRHFPAPVRRWLVTGGGRRNPVLMAALGARLRAPVDPVEALGWDGDALEAQAFAYLAVRSLLGLPLSLPGTTGVPRPTSGGSLQKAVQDGR